MVDATPSMFAGRSSATPLRSKIKCKRCRLLIPCVRVSKNAVAEERVDSGESFHRVECGGARGDAVRCERGLHCGRDGFLRERMWQRFEGGIVVEREVHAFVGFDE